MSSSLKQISVYSMEGGVQIPLQENITGIHVISTQFTMGDFKNSIKILLHCIYMIWVYLGCEDINRKFLLEKTILFSQ